MSSKHARKLIPSLFIAVFNGNSEYDNGIFFENYNQNYNNTNIHVGPPPPKKPQTNKQNKTKLSDHCLLYRRLRNQRVTSPGNRVIAMD